MSDHTLDALSAAAREYVADWAPAVDLLDWETPPRALWEDGPADGPEDGTWLPGGRLDPLWNLLGRHLPHRGERLALVWEGEPGDRRSLTYRELAEEVERALHLLVDTGVGPGDTVAVHAGWLPETVAVHLACLARGAVVTTIPVSLPVDALVERLRQVSPRLVVTQDGAWRRGSVLPLKARVDDALGSLGSVEHTLVVRRTGMDIPWFEGDVWYHEGAGNPRPRGNGGAHADGGDVAHGQGASTARSVGETAYAMYLASEGAEPLSTWHTWANVLLPVAAFAQSLDPEGIVWCAGDMSWAASTWNGLLGPLLMGGRAVIFEGTLDVPDRRRTWDVLARHDVTTLITSPSVLRTVRSWQPDVAEVRELLAPLPLKHVVTAGEAVEDDLYDWLHAVFADRGVEVVDAWGQVPLTGIVTVPAGREGLPRTASAVVDDQGGSVARGATGEMVLGLPVPGYVPDVRGAEADRVRRMQARFGTARYGTGDLVTVAAGSRPRYLGRTGAVVSVSGHLVSLPAVRRAILDHPWVEAAEVVPHRDTEVGVRLVAFVCAGRRDNDYSEAAQGVGRVSAGAVGTVSAAHREMAADLGGLVRDILGGLARPHLWVFVDRLPAGSHRYLEELVAGWDLSAEDSGTDEVRVHSFPTGD
ncbi:AMP-binding protein [Brevibacterium litoralis]|uniref:AMP-binding protein n=1 Tax=Brevibacterium litoralis TaxID=3138935 RepID=UPI0032F07DF2